MATTLATTQHGKLGGLLHRLLVERTADTRIQFLRYLAVGGSAFVADFSTLFAFTHWLRIHYLISNIFGFIVGLVVNYVLSLLWVFNTRKFTSRVAEFTLFGVIGVVGVGLSELILWLMTGLGGAHYLLSKLVATALVLLWNFGARKILVF